MGRKKSHIVKLEINSIQKQPPEVFCKKDVLRNFTKFIPKRLSQSLFFPLFSCEFSEISKNTFTWCYFCLLKSKKTNHVMLIGITIDNKLTFNEKIYIVDRSTKYLLNAVGRIRRHLTLGKTKLLIKSNTWKRYMRHILWHLKLFSIEIKILMNLFNKTMKFLSMKNVFVQLYLQNFHSLSNPKPECLWSYFVLRNLTHNIS